MKAIGLLGLLKKANAKIQQKKYIALMSGQTPIFNEFGNDIYASDIVQNCIRCLCTEMSKLRPKHIRTDNNGLQSEVNSDINRLLKQPNEVMTMSDFLSMITYLREVHKNVFIYPTYEEIDYGNGSVYRRYTGFYPLNPSEVEFFQDASNEIFVKFTFANFEQYTLKYSDVIHWRKDFGANELMGGDVNGQANNNALLKLLRTNDTITQGLDKAVKASLGIRGLFKINTMLSDDAQVEEVERFEQKIKSLDSGIIPIDQKSEYIPLILNPKIIDKDTLEFIDKRILNNFGVSLPIFNGEFTEEEYQAFYEKTLESMVLSLGRAFNKTLFTQRQRDLNNEIIFYSQGLLFTNMANKISAVDILSSRGVLTDNQILSIFGYPPFDGGDVRHISLNYINRDIADDYQLNKQKGSEKK